MNKYEEISTSKHNLIKGWSHEYNLRNKPTNCPRYFSCQNNKQSNNN